MRCSQLLSSFRCATLAALLSCSFGWSQGPAPPHYHPMPLTAQVIRSRGNKEMGKTMAAWEIAFRQYHPEITFEDTLLGSATGMAGITTGISDLTLLGRPVTPNEVIGFEWVHRVKPLGFEVMRGSLDAEGKSPALAVLVSRRNPITAVSMAQLATAFGCPASETTPATWALVGLNTDWARHPIHAYLYDNQTGTGSFLMQTVQGPRDCWNWSMVHEFTDQERQEGLVSPASRQIAESLDRDPYGLAISTVANLYPQLKALPITVDGKPLPLTVATVSDGSYPLARGVYIYVHRPKDKPVDPAVAEFLRFVLSVEGQAVVAATADYIPLNPAAIIAQRDKLQ